MPKQKISPEGLPEAIGYIRIDEFDPDQIGTLLKEIGDYCTEAGLRLMKTFCDQGYDGTQLARPGIVDVRTVLVNTDGMTVVVPSFDHLSPVEHIRSPLMLMIHRLGGKLVVIHEPNSPGQSSCEGDS